MNMNSTGARLRHAIKYPPSDSDTDTRADLDEQEQENVIEQLSQNDAETTAMYRKALMGLTLLGLMFVNIRADYSAHPIYYATCLAALSYSFLSAYDIYVPPTSTPISSQRQDANTNNNNNNNTPSFGTLDIPLLFSRGIQAGGHGASILRYIRDATNLARRTAWIVNPSLCALLAVVAWWSEERGVLVLSAAPVWVVCGVIVVARREMRMVRIGVGELEGLRYNLKGA